jgi:DNA-directed RNA polymerase specialized sigma subunit
MEYAIGEYITGQNAERNRDILKLYFLSGYSQERIAEIHDMSAVQVGRIVRDEGDYLMTKIK